MESEKSGLYWLCKEAENRSSAVDSPAPEVTQTAEIGVVVGEKRRRGRPAKAETEVTVKKRKKKEDEDVCFICFDGGSLVLCDRGDCPKAYHPACIKRDEAFFRSKAKWTCGWHLCSKCQKSTARYMCYTCTYSLCKGCTKDADYLCVRGNKGFCSTCFRVIKMIENIDQENQETVQVDFDDKLSWEYLFKVYWICLKTDLSLTVDEITHAQKPLAIPNMVTRREKSSSVYYLGNSGSKARENPTIPNNAISYTSLKSVRDDLKSSVVSTSWASKQLLDFVAYMRNDDTSALSQKEVQALLFDYIKRNNLRDPHQRSEIICDLKLENLFGKPRVRHFEMLSLLEFHFLTKDESQKDEIQGGIIDPVDRQVAGESNSDNLQMMSESYSIKVEKKDEERVDINRSHEVKNACEKLENHVDSSGSTNNGHNNQACLKSDSLFGVKSESSVASVSTGSTPSANDREVENSWHYEDPNGKVQGPFGIEQLHEWSLTGIFPPDMRIWRLNTEERDSVLLADVIKDQVPSQNNPPLSHREVKGTSFSTSHRDEPKSGGANSAEIDTDDHSNGKLEMAKGNGPVPHSSNWKAPVVNNNLQINNDAHIERSSKCPDLKPSKAVDSYLDSPQVKSDAQIESSSKCWDPVPLKVVDSCLNHPQVKVDAQIKSSAVIDSYVKHPQIKNDAPVKSSSQCLDQEPLKVVETNLNHPQVKNDDHINSSSKCSDPIPPKVVDTYLNHPQVKNDAHIETFLKYSDSKPTKGVDTYSNNPQVKNDAQIKRSPKCWDPESPKVVDSYSNQLQVNKSVESKISSKNLDHEPPKVVDSYLVRPQVNNDVQIKRASKYWDPEPPKVVNSYLNQPQVDNEAQMKTSSKYWDLEPFKVVDSYSNQPQVNNDAQISSLKCWDSEPPKVVDSYLNQPQVNNDAQIKSCSKGWDVEPPKVVDLHLNQPQVHSVERSSPFKEKPQETILNQDRSKVRQMWNPTPNYENWSFQGNMVQTTGRECHANQINEHHYLGHPSSETPVRQNSWKSHEAHPHYTAMANLTDSSEEKFAINLQEFPIPMPKTSTQVLESQNIKEQQRWPPPQVSFQNFGIQNELSLTPMAIDHDEKDYFQNQKVSSLTDNFEKVRATDNTHSLSSNFSIEDCGPSWSSAKKSNNIPMEEWNSSFLSVCSLRPHDVANNFVATSTSKGDEFPPPSPPNPVPNASSWLAMMTEPFEFNTLAEESVSDLLAEVDAMESNSDLESPNLLMDYADDLFHDSKNDCFTSLRGLSSPQDQVKNDALCASIDIMLPPQSNTRDGKIRPPSNDVIEPSKKSKRQSSMSSVMEVETKRFEIPNNQFESRSNKHNLSPPKKIRDLADIMNAPTKHGNLNSTGSTRRESGQGTPRGSGSRNKSTLDGMSGRESSHQKHGEKLTSPRERMPGRESRPSWSRQSLSGGGGGGSGSHSRSLPRSQRVCKFYENGHCRKGAFCEYLHP